MKRLILTLCLLLILIPSISFAGFGGFLREDTAVDVLIGPFVDDADGDTADTDATLDVELSKAGQALANKTDATAPVHDAAGTVDGYYNCELDATDTNTPGTLTLVVHHADDLPIRLDFQVMARGAYDSRYGTDAPRASAAVVSTTIATLASQTSFTLTAGSADNDAYNNCIIIVEDSTTATQKAVGRISAYTGATKTITLEADPGIFTMATTDYVDIIAVEKTWTASTRSLTILDEDTTTIDLDAEIEKGTTASLVTHNLDHLLTTTTGVAADGDLETYAVAGSLWAHAFSVGADITTFKATTDSLEAIRVHADTIKAETVLIVEDTGTTLDVLIKDIPTTAEIALRTILAADYVVVGDTIAGVTLVTTTTTNSDMVAAPLNAAETEAEVEDALQAMNLDHLLKVDTTVAADGDLEAYVVAGTVMGHLLSTSADATLYKASTDSLQALRDRGDSAWTTGGGSGLTALASGTSQGGGDGTNIILAGAHSFANDELNGCSVNIHTGTGAGQSRVIYDYTGASDTADVTPNWTTNPGADSQYEVVQGSANLVAILNAAVSTTTAQIGANVEAWNNTAVPADVQAGYPTVTIKDGTGVGELNTLSGSVVNVDLVDLTTTAGTVTTLTGHTAQSQDHTTNVNAIKLWIDRAPF